MFDPTESDPLLELQSLLEAIEGLAPQRDPDRAVRYRMVAPDEVVEDSLGGSEPLDGEPSDEAWQDASAQGSEESSSGGTEFDVDWERNEDFDYGDVELRQFSDAPGVAVTAIDCGIARLGETEDGLIIALRACALAQSDGPTRLHRFRTGPIYLRNADKAAVLHLMGIQMGRPDFFVELDSPDSPTPNIVRVKRGVADDSHQYGDRFRNWLERLVQMLAVRSTRNGIILFDGALTLRTRDTPRWYLEKLASVAHENGNSIVAISKQSMLAVQGRPIRFWLNDVPHEPCFRLLSSVMRREGSERVLGNAYAARFTPMGSTFRMDVKALPGLSDEEVISQFYSSNLFRGGYPGILVQAHIHSYFTSPQVIQLQAQAGAQFRLRPQPEAELGGIFGLFGGRYK